MGDNHNRQLQTGEGEQELCCIHSGGAAAFAVSGACGDGMQDSVQKTSLLV